MRRREFKEDAVQQRGDQTQGFPAQIHHTQRVLLRSRWEKGAATVLWEGEKEHALGESVSVCAHVHLC
jgi:hypothetical protein